MATSKSKKAAPKGKASSKAKASVKSAKTTKKTSASSKRVVGKTTTKKAPASKKVVASKKVAESKVTTKEAKPAKKGFFAKKYEGNESILTIFKRKSTYGALIGELVGTMLITIIFLTMLQLNEPVWMLFSILAVILAVYRLSGSNLNPAVTIGMMATRRMSVIRGVLYIVAQVLGAWIGMLILAQFCSAGDTGNELPKMAAIEDDHFWLVTMIEFFGASIIGFCFARAHQYRRSSFTFSITAAGGIMLAIIVALVISILYGGLSSNFVLNPAVAFMYKILPTGGTEFMEVLSAIAVALTTYVIAPAIGSTIGFYLADTASFLVEE